jgi:hypothetical protein
MLILEKQPDRVDPAMPIPEVRAADDFHATITQVIPAGFDVPRFAWHLAGSFPRQRLNGIGEQAIKPLAYEVQQPQGTLRSGTREFSLGVATDRDGSGDARQRAIDLAGPDPAKDYDNALEVHERSWDEFWSASDIELGDKEIEAVWYRQMYLWACHVAPQRAQEKKHPILAGHVIAGSAANLPASKSFVDLEPDTMAVTSWLWRDGAYEMRLYDTSGSGGPVEVHLPGRVTDCRAVDFTGRAMARPVVSVRGNTARFTARPWEIVTLRFSLGAG